jgi:DNA-binding response OmpR family regulator
MRAGRIDIPVLILSDVSRPDAKVKGLGADDFITKPFDTAELIAPPSRHRPPQQGLQPAHAEGRARSSSIRKTAK